MLNGILQKLRCTLRAEIPELEFDEEASFNLQKKQDTEDKSYRPRGARNSIHASIQQGHAVRILPSRVLGKPVNQLHYQLSEQVPCDPFYVNRKAQKAREKLHVEFILKSQISNWSSFDWKQVDKSHLLLLECLRSPAHHQQDYGMQKLACSNFGFPISRRFGDFRYSWQHVI